MLLNYQNLIIRNATPTDAAKLAAWWNDGAIMAHAGFPLGIGKTPEAIAADLAGDTDETRRRLIMEIDGIPIGDMNYENHGGAVAEIGIDICEAAKQDSGLGRKLLSMLISELFGEMGYQKIILTTNLKNKRAQHVYETLGFQKVGIAENSWKNQVGEWQSTVEYELLPEDFVDFTK